MSVVKRGALAAAAVLLVALSAAAFACANLATLALSTSEGESGATVTVNGASFTSPQPGDDQPPTPVVLHWRSEGGPVLAETVPDRLGAISTSFTVPVAAPGVYLVFATQSKARWPPDAPPDAPAVPAAEPGTPARARFEVLASVGTVPAARVPVVDEPSESSPQLDPSIWVALIATLGAVAILLLGSGLVAFLYQSRQAKLPPEARWVPPGW